MKHVTPNQIAVNRAYSPVVDRVYYAIERRVTYFTVDPLPEEGKLPPQRCYFRNTEVPIASSPPILDTSMSFLLLSSGFNDGRLKFNAEKTITATNSVLSVVEDAYGKYGATLCMRVDRSKRSPSELREALTVRRVNDNSRQLYHCSNLRRGTLAVSFDRVRCV
ncbi:hypothetical protein KM043_001633 [Ampulex compressa]|nr:hypothetical protein KM043_001633 [Ampulex compressa]